MSWPADGVPECDLEGAGATHNVLEFFYGLAEKLHQLEKQVASPGDAEAVNNAKLANRVQAEFNLAVVRTASLERIARAMESAANSLGMIESHTNLLSELADYKPRGE